MDGNRGLTDSVHDMQADGFPIAMLVDLWQCRLADLLADYHAWGCVVIFSHSPGFATQPIPCTAIIVGQSSQSPNLLSCTPYSVLCAR